MRVPTTNQLINMLQQHQLLEAGQLSTVRHIGTSYATAQDLARELLRRDWLTPYQVNQLLLGRATDLVQEPYILLKRLGEGGAGQVFQARHRLMRRMVALKIIRPDLLTDTEVVQRFMREMRVASQLTHPNVVHAYDAGPLGNSFFLAMEYVEGNTLLQLVRQSGPLPILQACSYLEQAALGLQHAHERGLVHRDIKPPNFLVTHTAGGPPLGTIKLLDLGLARLQRAVPGEMTNLVTPAGPVMLGTPDYMAPEQALDFHKADHRADIYSLGCTFYFVLTGQPPFAGGSLAQKLLRHQQMPPRSLREIRPDVPAELDAIILKMLAKQPTERFQQAVEIATVVAQLQARLGQAGSIPLAVPLHSPSPVPAGSLPQAVPLQAEQQGSFRGLLRTGSRWLSRFQQAVLQLYGRDRHARQHS